jgi:diguanylate cyclase (GGDEF)-like protein
MSGSWLDAWLLRPRRLVLLLLLLAAPLCLLLGHWGAVHWTAQRQQSLIADAEQRLGQRIRHVEQELRALLGLRGLLLSHWVREPRLLALLREPANPAVRAAADAYLAELVQLGLSDLAWLIDADGLCLAASNHGQPDSPVGTRYTDRLYYQQARRGELAHQYLIGRRTRTPGLHHALALRGADGQVIGVLASKLQLSRLAEALELEDGFVSDEQGLVIVATRPAWAGRLLADAPAWQLADADRQARYGRRDFEPLPLRSVELAERPALSLLEDEDGVPAMVQVLRAPSQGLSVHLLEPLGLLKALQRERQQLALLLASGGLLASWALAVSAIFLLRGRLHDRQTLAQQAALQALNQQLAEQALRDPLTGCANRRALLQRLDEELQRRRRVAHPLSVAMIDIDHFKSVNDRFGHAVGDQALRHVAATLQAGLRGSDLLARVGGEEFVLMLVDTPQPAALALLERLRAGLAAAPLPSMDEALTASMGLAEAQADDDCDSLLARADAGLYAAKAGGRNRVCQVQ